MEHNKWWKNWLLVLDVIAFFVSVVLSIIAVAIIIIHAFTNPNMTFTQLIIWVICSTKWWIPIAILIISYIGIIIYNERLNRKK